MTPKTLAFTRRLVSIAATVSGFIIANAAKITAAATAIHAWALAYSIKLADKAANKEYERYNNLTVQIDTVRKLAQLQYDQWCITCNKADLHAAAANEELVSLGRA